jgi:hypothetical protein
MMRANAKSWLVASAAPLENRVGVSLPLAQRTVGNRPITAPGDRPIPKAGSDRPLDLFDRDRH